MKKNPPVTCKHILTTTAEFVFYSHTNLQKDELCEDNRFYLIDCCDNSGTFCQYSYSPNLLRILNEELLQTHTLRCTIICATLAGSRFEIHPNTHLRNNFLLQKSYMDGKKCLVHLQFICSTNLLYLDFSYIRKIKTTTTTLISRFKHFDLNKEADVYF